MDRNRLCSLLLLAFLLSGASAAADPQEKRQYWKKDYGPLVPHKTFPKECSLCHVAKRWDVLRSDFKFDHEKETGYRLEGAHAFAACLRCHNDRGAVQKFAARGCAGCHGDPHKSTMGFDCLRCHDQNSWRPSGAIAGHAQTRFPLTGMHAALECEKCHVRAQAGDFKGTLADCASCHDKEYRQAPNHVAMNFSRSCQSCHNTVSWASANFNHASLGPNPDCNSCHAADFARGPNHVSNNFSRSCANCHNTASWASAGFNHASLGPNPDCNSCHAADFARGPNHVSNNFSRSCANCHNTASWASAGFNHASLGANPQCYSCHADDYARGPNHVANNFSQSCGSCHNTTSWSGATFSHASLGANPVCYNCHAADYQRGPNHVAMSYPTTCQNCHNTSAWGAATFNHQFRLRGEHNVSCTICHQGGNTATFTCLVCHDHSQARMDDKHRERPGYRYESLACYQCHPQ